MTRREAAAVNVLLDYVFGHVFEPDELEPAAVLLAGNAWRKLERGWTGEQVHEAAVPSWKRKTGLV